MNNKHITMQSKTEFLKYALIGIGNVAIEIVIINILSCITGITRGKMLFIFNIIAFLAYSTYSYYMNKSFTFKKNIPECTYFQYASVLFFCMIINSLMLVVLTCNNPLLVFMQGRLNTSTLNHIWMNIAILLDSIVTGFLGFSINKSFVFNKNKACKN